MTTPTMELIATSRPQLEAAHTQMLEWVKFKLEAVDIEIREEGAALDVAVRSGWKARVHERHLTELNRRKVFYMKIQEAINAGYVIVPNFELDVFAVRTDAQTPRGGVASGEYNRFPQGPKLLPSGEGRYVDLHPFVRTQRISVPSDKGGTKEVVSQWPTGFDEVQFPIALAKPVLMEQVSEAMKKRLFDEIGVATDSWSGRTGRPDPIIVGRLRNPRKSAPAISFFIGWYFDASRL